MTRLFAGFAAAVLSAGAVTAQAPQPGLPSGLPTDPAAPNPFPAEKFPPNKLEKALIDGINAARKEAGVPDLETHQILTVEAQGFVKSLAAAGSMGHEANGKSFRERVKATGYPYRAVAEVVTEHPTADGAADRWMGSKPHKETVLYPDYRDIGVATATTKDGSRFWVAILGEPTEKPGPGGTDIDDLKLKKEPKDDDKKEPEAKEPVENEPNK